MVSFNINGIIGLLLESLGKGDRGQEAYCNRISFFLFDNFFSAATTQIKLNGKK